jgi:hypothetical protein
MKLVYETKSVDNNPDHTLILTIHVFKHLPWFGIITKISRKNGWYRR